MAGLGRARVLAMLLMVCLVGCTSRASGSEPVRMRTTPRLVPNAPFSSASGGSASQIPVTPPLKFVATDSKGMALEASASITGGRQYAEPDTVASPSVAAPPSLRNRSSIGYRGYDDR